MFTLLNNVLSVCLGDNWSQVRMAASTLCRTLFSALEDDKKHKFYPRLLPRMCLNRFYLAQGVKLYSHDTWKQVFAEDGVKQVAHHIGPVARYYVKMADADNHVVREAACQGIAEIAAKLGPHPVYSSSLEPYVHQFLQALLMCFYDESWPVRDEACLACGIFVKAYPQHCEDTLSELIPLWLQNLMDPIWSVRERAALALADAISAYDNNDLVLSPILQTLTERLPMAKSQPSMSQKLFLQMQNDIDKHTGNQLYSCGSLAPKLKKGSVTKKRHMGCSDCIVGPPALWEITDGCLYLLRELFLLDVLTKSQQIHFLSQTIEVCRVKHFPQADELRTTLWRVLPDICNFVGKTLVKREFLHLFLDLLVENALSQYASNLSVCEAQKCITALSNLVGKRLLLGRIEDDSQRIATENIFLLDEVSHTHYI